MELPLFDGGNPWGWIAKAERYFQMNGMDERERIPAVILCFEGEALSWWQFRELWQPFREWRELKEELLLRFGLTQNRTPYEQIILHRQTGTIAEYRARFEQLVAMLPAVSIEWLKGAFMAGLSPRIQAELRLLAPTDLRSLMQMAADVEQRDWALYGMGGNSGKAEAAQPGQANSLLSAPTGFYLHPPFPSPTSHNPNQLPQPNWAEPNLPHSRPNQFHYPAYLPTAQAHPQFPASSPPLTQAGPLPNISNPPNTIASTRIPYSILPQTQTQTPSPTNISTPSPSTSNFPPPTNHTPTHSATSALLPPSSLPAGQPKSPSHGSDHSSFSAPPPTTHPSPLFSKRPPLPPFPRRLSQPEIQARIAQGLCFKCGDKYSFNHQCRFRQLRLMLCEDGEEESTEPTDAAPEPPHQDGQDIELSSHSVAGINSPRSMKLLGKISETEVVVLVDSGATHSFLSQQVVKDLALQIHQKAFSVTVGNGQSIKGGGVCRAVKLHLGSIHFLQDFYVFQLGNVDVILGMDWLSTLGIVHSDWQSLTMWFNWNGQQVSLQGDPSLTIRETSLRGFCKTLKSSNLVYWIELTHTVMEDSSPEQPEITAVLQHFQHLFEEPSGLPPRQTRDHAIRLVEGAIPPNIRPYRYPHHQKNEVERQIQDMLKAGIICPSISPFSNPVLLVQKKDGGWRFCVDYRVFNKLTIPDKFPIPAIDELLDELSGATIFSKLDLKSGYHQIRIVDNDIEKTTFRTHNGHYEFLVMPFGLSNAPATFQALMNTVFRDHLRRFILVFFDDILIYSRDLADHLEHLHTALTLLSEHHLVLNRKKCSFAVTQLEYLGHIISASRVAADPKKIQCMVDWPLPKDITELRGFLGLTGYYRRFVRNYGRIAAPLTQLLKKNSFLWSDEATHAFETLKKTMTTVPVLAMPDFTQPFIVETDASAIGIGAVLMQGGRPISFMSQALSPRSQAKSIYERELMAIVLALQKWRHYLLGKHFIVRTDQKSLKYLMEQQL
ncbi:uncharacterized protein LOC123202715 [Mangifera indica]|uniref:uncharacterized protein LOC123202715 n=1 Tax=Mangifera indica TaxID=29780 RepID=UPI001CFA9CD3|nr:uncharacterized protein LOC123202715 [Mangifera indica]XP_044474695.1 uncharacterized protein LOC123202715 [Mangifera indica]XP_044474696.1 uncharacterized protein LOC123202715 [Mangifera indica]XP_044474697.1 uncharacterized protein LOC123202715 [Mangifera indica]XP_044474698.1 uncharacterized protein LOC123202715 [Mangifera indica]XP_044474700.1 uncharacterized protein LOC123202715 [Mangifera indica]XP_044474701.1 uncharacterized protein LOC123202715 [Mangifera indica]